MVAQLRAAFAITCDFSIIIMMDPAICEEIMKVRLLDQVVNMFSKILLENTLSQFNMSDVMLMGKWDEIVPNDSK